MKNRVKKPTQTERITFRLCPELQVRLVAVAEKQERTPSWVVEKCVKKLLPELEKEVSFDAPDFRQVGLKLAA